MKHIFLFFLFSISLFASPLKYHSAVLRNGIEVIFIKVSENPVISSTVVVKVGLKHETKDINGVSHLLEHLMFNGTEKRSQQQLYRDFDAIGCYNNASTSDHYTAYYLLTTRENFEKGIEIQSDMLFHSIIPENKIGKEKGIVIEEIRKDKVSPAFFEDLAFRKAIFKGTPYEMKVIGSEDSVRAISREEIYRFYKKYYSPENVVILVAGDFEEKNVFDILNRYFGNIKPQKIEQKQWSLKWDKNYEVITESNLPYSVFYLVIKGVKANSPDFPTQECYTELLGMSVSNMLMEIDPQASVSSDYTDDYGLIKIRVKVKDEGTAKEVKGALLNIISKHNFISKEKVREYRVSKKAATLFALERPHFFGMLNAPYLAAGCRGLIFYPEVNIKDVELFAEKVRDFEKKSVFIKGGK